jgi:hypothetical protein
MRVTHARAQVMPPEYDSKFLAEKALFCKSCFRQVRVGAVTQMRWELERHAAAQCGVSLGMTSGNRIRRSG